jgi:hypothetical protein
MEITHDEISVVDDETGENQYLLKLELVQRYDLFGDPAYDERELQYVLLQQEHDFWVLHPATSHGEMQNSTVLGVGRRKGQALDKFIDEYLGYDSRCWVVEDDDDEQ